MKNPAQASLYRRRAAAGDDNMVPLINIVFLLLIFFMVAGKIGVDHARNIELPSALPQATAVAHDINIVLDAAGNLQMNGVSLDLVSLPVELDKLMADTVDISVAVQADAHLQARQLTPVLSVLRAARIGKIRLFTRAGEKE